MSQEAIHILRATDGNINVQSIDPFDDSQLVVKDDAPIQIIRIDEERRITVDGNDILTGEVQIIADQNIQVIKVIEQGPKGDRGEKGEPGLSGAGKPFYEVISGELFESTSSISITNHLNITGSAFVQQSMAIGEDIVSSPPARLQVLGHDTGSVDIIRFGNQTQEFMRINSEGVTIFGQTSGSQPTAVAGGFYFSGDAFYVGI